MTSTTDPQLTDVHDMVVVHRAFRREFGLLPRLVRDVRPGDTSRARVLAGHARMVLKGLHLHHTSEDDLLWPKLLERATPEAALIARMEGQHEQVEHHLAQLGPALDRWEAEARPAVTEEVAATLEALTTVLLVHLDEEEREILPIAARHITPAEWAELGDHGLAAMSRSELPILAGMVLEEATAAKTAEMVAKPPLPARVLLRPVLLPHYRRYVRRVRGIR
jgi:iron-sulfur cluster repair protein YtfE (RIC family)